MDPVSIQIGDFLITIFCGLLIGCLFDGYRVIRGILNPKTVFTDIGDLVFWVCSTAVVFAALLWSNWGEVRLYVFVGMMMGLSVYVRFVSGPMTLGMLKIWKTVCLMGKWIFGFVNTLIWQPVRWSLQLLVRPLVWAYRKPGSRLAKAGCRWKKKYKEKILKGWLNFNKPPDPPAE